VKAELITTRLLSDDDKNDMMNGDLPIEALQTHVAIWVHYGMPDYRNAKFVPYAIEKLLAT